MQIEDIACPKCLKLFRTKAGGQMFYVRKNTPVNPKSIRKMRSDGMTVLEIAKTINLTPRRIWQLLEKV